VAGLSTAGSHESTLRTSLITPFTGDTISAPQAMKMSVAGYPECVGPHDAGAGSASGVRYGVVVGTATVVVVVLVVVEVEVVGLDVVGLDVVGGAVDAEVLFGSERSPPDTSEAALSTRELPIEVGAPSGPSVEQPTTTSPNSASSHARLTIGRVAQTTSHGVPHGQSPDEAWLFASSRTSEWSCSNSSSNSFGINGSLVGLSGGTRRGT